MLYYVNEQECSQYLGGTGPNYDYHSFLAHPAGGQMSFCHGAASGVRLSVVRRLSSVVHNSLFLLEY